MLQTISSDRHTKHDRLDHNNFDVANESELEIEESCTSTMMCYQKMRSSYIS